MRAQWLLTETPFHNLEPGSVGIGFGLRFGQSPYVGVDDIGSVHNEYNYDLVPLYLYEGDYLFSHGMEAGVHFFRPNKFNLDLILRYRFDRLEVESNDYFEGLEDRRQTVDTGIAMSYTTDNFGQLRLSAVTDLLSRHEGEEVDLTYRYPFTTGNWTFTPSLSLVYQSRDLTNYYYGVSPDEATPDRPAYDADSALFLRAGINTAYVFGDHWQLFLNLAYEALDDTVKDSPLTDRSNLFAAYFGASYTLGNAKHVETQKPDTKLWSWRINAGYTVDDTFSQVLLGNFKPHDEVDTYLAGFTLGRLLNDGKRGDIWGRVSINRRFENDIQKDFNEYVFYVQTMGSGYSPWTDRELFRFGFGVGVSYAERVPAVEQYKQSGRGEQTSHWLNYMEAQLDFPLRTLFGKRGSEDCYLGLTLVHRSGIFGRSDVFNSVQGGSEVLTGHLECKM